MTTYDFDEPINRRGTDSLKFDAAQSRHRRADLLPLWVADMDFRAPQEVLDAIAQRTAHGVFGYTEPGQDYFDALGSWLGAYGWRPKADEVVVTPGVVFSLATAVRAFTNPGDAVLVQPPVYYPFSQVVKENGRVLAEAALVYQGGAYAIDFDAFEQTLAASKAKLFLLCNPHNPVGRAWSVQELRQLGQICLEHGAVVVSDEIHMDFARPGHVHTSFAALGSQLAENCVVCTSASKTFNLAGLQVANTAIFNEELRARFAQEVSAAGYSQANTLGLAATKAAYQHGATWLGQLKAYLEGNWELMATLLAQDAPELSLVQAQSTYLAWIDCSALGISGKQLGRFCEDEAGLWVDPGSMFGEGGKDFIRINIATQRAYLSQALEQLGRAVRARMDKAGS